MGKENRAERVATGVFKDRGRLRGYVLGSDGRLRTKRFPTSASVRDVEHWRAETRRLPPDDQALARFAQLRPRGWCYLYVIGSERGVKIGRAVDPRARLRTLQIGSVERLELLATAPIHWTLEGLLQARFRAHHLVGEWFARAPEIDRFIDDLKAGKNPASWVW